jgi:hypothetical protein
MPKNNNCDNDKCKSDTGEVRVLPTSADGNAILCQACFDHEIRFRRQENHRLGFMKDGFPTADAYELPKWDSLKVYEVN